MLLKERVVVRNLIYLDNAATTFPKPKEVYAFMNSFYQIYGANPGRAGYSMTLETEEVVFQTRKMLCELFNGTDPDRLTFSYNATDSLNIIINGMLSKGDHVITSCLEHNSVLRPLYHKEQDGFIEVTYIPFDAAGYIRPEDIKSKIKHNTKMVVLNHASNVIGTVQPVAEVGKICRETGICFALDASQTAGIIKIDVQEMNIDLLAFTGHKSLLGPTGIGGSYVADNVPIKASRFGGTGVRSVERTHPDEFPYRLECGTLNVLGVAGLYAGQKWIRDKGMLQLHQQQMHLWSELRKGLSEIDGVVVYCADDSENHTAVLSFTINKWKSGDVGTILGAHYRIACRTGLQCAPLAHVALGTDKLGGTVRFSLGPFNTEEHVDKAIEAVRKIAAIEKR
jgi:cysteine desulfurase / selenocysteine lyase